MLRTPAPIYNRLGAPQHDGHARRTRLREPTTSALYELAAATLFGMSAPVAKRLLGEVEAQILAGLLYLGVDLGVSLWMSSSASGV
jgi:hypothetical protein